MKAQPYRPPMTDAEVADYVTNTIDLDTGFQTSLHIIDGEADFTININACQWRFLIQVYRLFKVVEAGPPEDVVEDLEQLYIYYDIAYATAQKVYGPATCECIRTYLASLYGTAP